MPDLQQNLEDARNRLSGHRDTCPDCRDRFEAGRGDAIKHAALLPLSHGTSEAFLEKIWRDQSIRSHLRVNNGVVIPASNGDARVEVVLGTNDDVFTFVGPFRYPAHTGLLFASDLETDFPREMSATAFDSGALVGYIRPKHALGSTPQFFEANQLPVPEYRTFLAEFIASLFAPCASYFARDVSSGCEAAITVEGESADLRRQTFEVRFRGFVPLNAHLAAVFIPSYMIDREFAKDIVADCEDRGIELVILSADSDEDAYDQLLSESEWLLANLL